MTDRVTEQTEKVTETATATAGAPSETLRAQAVSAFSGAAKDILGPAIQQMSRTAAEQAAGYLKDEGPKLVKEQVLPQVMKQVGADTPQDVVKAGVGKAGEAISDAGGITGFAGKLMSKIGGGGKQGATGFGKGRRMPVQQQVMVGVPLDVAFTGWTEYKRWPEFMHRANGSDPQPQDDSFRLRVTEKMWGFTRPFTAEVVEQYPNESIRWKSVDGPRHVGVISFHSLGDRLTMISVSIDHAPAGPIEKIARGARFDKRAIRADLSRFKAWIELKSQDEIDDMDGWQGTIEDSKITTSHEDAMGETATDEPEERDEPDEPDEPEAEADEEPEEEEAKPKKKPRVRAR